MAVFQISKIQIRRGKASSGAEFPQLSSGEMGWAIDTQELFIGNGAVSEGAPAVGNTKILTEHDDMLTGARYSYKLLDHTFSTGSTLNSPIFRTLQDRLDNDVTILEFNAIGDNIHDDTAAFRRAITQLFSSAYNFTDRHRVILRIPEGKYIISDTITIPSYATLVGAGIDKTIIVYTGASAVFRCITNNNQTLSSSTQPTTISIQGMTIQSSVVLAECLDLSNACNSIFRDIKISGGWTTGVRELNIGIKLYGNTTGSVVVPVKNNIFENIQLEGFYYGIYCNQDIQDNMFNNISIINSNSGVVFNDAAATTYTPTRNQIVNSKFKNITTSAIYVIVGTFNNFSNCVLTNVGTTTPQIYLTTVGNNCDTIRSNRFDTYSLTSNSNRYVPEIAGHGRYQSNMYTTTLSNTAGATTSLFRLPIHSTYSGSLTGTITYVIDYTYTSTYVNLIRHGVITIIAKSSNLAVSLSDDYTSYGLSNSADELLLSFSAVIANNTIVFKFTNQLTSDTGTLNYSYIATF